MEEGNNLNKLNEPDQELLDNIEKIIAHQSHPATSLLQMAERLANSEIPARAAFRRGLEAQLLVKLAAPPAPGANPTLAPALNEAKIVGFLQSNVEQPSQRNKPAFRRRFSWNNLVLAGMVAVVVVMVGLIGLVVAMNGSIVNSTSTAGRASVQAGAGNTPQVVTNAASQTYKIELKVRSQKPDKLSLQATQQVIEQRLNALGVSNTKIVIESDQLITVVVQDVKNVEQVSQLISTTGLIEVIDPAGQKLAPGEQVSTSICLKRSGGLTPCSGTTSGANVTNPVNGKPTITGKALPSNNGSQPFQTLLTSDQLDIGTIEQTTNSASGAPMLRIGLKDDPNNDILLKFAKANKASQFTVTLDGLVLNTFPLVPSTPEMIEITSQNWNSAQGKIDFSNFVILLKFGPLPLDLAVQSIQPS